jgi:phenylalanyl-tRNA synthetase alpha chain
MSVPIDPSIGHDRALLLFQEEWGEVRTDADLQALRSRWVGRKGSWVAAFMDLVGRAAPADKRALGRQANELKQAVEAAIAERETARAASRRPAGSVDVTLSGQLPLAGYRHPISLVRDEVIAIFTRLGYQVLEGPEVEDDYHNFEALNMPPAHPARDMQDTLYLANPLPPLPTSVPDQAGDGGRRDDRPGGDGGRRDDRPGGDGGRQGDRPGGDGGRQAGDGGRAAAPAKVGRAPDPRTLLRTHTSAMQIRYMEEHGPPVRLIAIGPVYRRDNLDLTHTPMFHQCEGLVVGPRITLADLKGTLISMARALFGEGQDVRFRPSFFPYTEPSAEVDIRCIRCQGVGCAICRRTGWLEILGSGMVHPSVFEYVGYDPEKVTGFAFGMGLERVAILKWDVDDIRLFYENDLRFLEQFGQ